MLLPVARTMCRRQLQVSAAAALASWLPCCSTLCRDPRGQYSASEELQVSVPAGSEPVSATGKVQQAAP